MLYLLAALWTAGVGRMRMLAWTVGCGAFCFLFSLCAMMVGRSWVDVIDVAPWLFGFPLALFVFAPRRGARNVPPRPARNDATPTAPTRAAR